MAAFESTLGHSAATSYISVATADAFFAGTLVGGDWTALSEADKEASLMAATSNLDTLSYKGERCDPSTDDANLPQALKWPRSGITCDGVTITCAALPRPIVTATCLLALQLHSNPDAIIGAPTATTGSIKKQKLGDLEQEFYDVKEGQNAKIDATAPILLQKFPWLVDILPTCLLATTGGSSQILLRVRA